MGPRAHSGIRLPLDGPLVIALRWYSLRFLLGTVVLITGCKDASISKAISGFGAAKFLGLTKVEPPVFQPIPRVQLEPNETRSIPLVLDRKGNEGPIKLSLDGLPQGLEGTVQDVSAGSSSSTLSLRADPSLGDEDLTATLTVIATAEAHSARMAVSVQVPRVPRPSISSGEPIVLQPGKEAEIALPVVRNGWEAEIPLAVEQCPKSLAATVATVPHNESSAHVTITVDATATDGPTSFLLSWDAYGRRMTAEVPVIIEQVPYAIDTPIAVTLKPAESCDVPVRIRRSAYRGPVTLSLAGLPNGVQASSSNLAADVEEGTVLIKADATAHAEYAAATIEANGTHISVDGLFVIRVEEDISPATLPPAIVMALSSFTRPRTGGIEARFSEKEKASLDQFYGTTPASKPAVIDGLRWLASTQSVDGSWSLTMAPNRSTGGFRRRPPLEHGQDDPEERTALAVLPFLADGISHEQEPDRSPELMEYTDVVKKALVYLARKQAAAAGPGSGQVGNSLRSQILSLRAFSEAYALSDNTKLKPYAKKAADFLIDQQSKNGGWGADGGTNALDTAQALVALRLARACRIGVSSLVLRRGEKFLATCCAGPAPNNSSMYALQPGDLPDADATAAGLLAVLYADPHPTPAIRAGGDFFLKQAPALHASHTNQSGVSLLLATQVLRTIEGEQFDRWNALLRMFLTANQITSGDQSGSWDPETFGTQTDVVQASSLAVLCLQSNYRYLPLVRTVNGTREESAESSSDEPPDESDGN